MTIASRELFELCKQVYEATGWGIISTPCWIDNATEKHAQQGYPKITNYVGIRGEWEYGKRYGLYIMYPLYTSDYLLEKLPNGTTILKDVQGFKAWNVYNRKRIATYTCDSFVEVLLKLTLKLHEEKQL